MDWKIYKKGNFIFADSTSEMWAVSWSIQTMLSFFIFISSKEKKLKRLCVVSTYTDYCKFKLLNQAMLQAMLHRGGWFRNMHLCSFTKSQNAYMLSSWNLYQRCPLTKKNNCQGYQLDFGASIRFTDQKIVLITLVLFTVLHHLSKHSLLYVSTQYHFYNVRNIEQDQVLS